MGRRIHTLGDEFTHLFNTFEHAAYRLETLQRYAVDYEDGRFRRFLAGEPTADSAAKREWVSLIRDAVAAGKRMARVHVVVEPPSDYMRYELTWGYEDNVEAGEDIRIIPVERDRWVDGLPENHDYWLFDSRDLWVMQYAEDGRFLFAENIDDPAEIVEHNRMRDVAMQAAITYVDYLRHRPELVR